MNPLPPMTLSDQLAAANESNRAQLTAPALSVMDRASAALAATDPAAGAVSVGDTAPLFALPNAIGQTVRLGDLLAQGPVVLSFYRGGWCPYCSLELKALQDALPAITEAGARLALDGLLDDGAALAELQGQRLLGGLEPEVQFVLHGLAVDGEDLVALRPAEGLGGRSWVDGGDANGQRAAGWRQGRLGNAPLTCHEQGGNSRRVTC